MHDDAGVEQASGQEVRPTHHPPLGDISIGGVADGANGADGGPGGRSGDTVPRVRLGVASGPSLHQPEHAPRTDPQRMRI
eukprot:6194016-Pleurochrysis_carterae.AAC.3